MLKHSESVKPESESLRLDPSSPISKHINLRSTWKGRSFFNSTKKSAAGDYGTSIHFEEEDDVVFAKLTKFEDKMKNAEDRYLER